MNNLIIGYLASCIAALFFGSNFVPINKIQPKLGDGMFFQSFMSSGIYFIGILSLFLPEKPMFVQSGLIGGALVAIALLLVPITLEFLGLGLGALFWNGSDLITGYMVGRFGLFGTEKEEVKSEFYSISGFVLAFFALILFYFIKPITQEDQKSEERIRLLQDPKIIEEKKEKQFDEYLQEQNNTKLIKKIRLMKKKTKHLIGVILAIIVGIFTGVNLIPMMIWSGDHPNAGHFDFVFSHFTGIFLSGVLWAIACISWFVSTRILGFAVGYPIVCIGPILITSLWSIFYFREIKGKKNFLIFFSSFGLFIIAVTFLVLSKT
ncbi:hypothetical protein M0811_09209 [Anaeramoeba ignava]|uniref:Uncharacterized protein n=1 Tax=Anaeramoeba ignava TaxID=1746090 RepID=A0A9Q0LKU3_ANAIG|nr:hypothetical protein M0811_09209 [Anaeramoeba ignava]